MRFAEKINGLHQKVRANQWLYLFAIFNRIVLAAGFIPSGLQKVLGYRFTALPANHPMGHYLDALFQTGYYYTFIGIAQVTAAILLLIPRTAALGAFLYFPIILNICVLSFSLRFDGSLLSSPLMVLANLYLICWYFHRWKFLLPFKQAIVDQELVNSKPESSRFPLRFFSASAAVVLSVLLVVLFAFQMMPRNTLKECNQQCDESTNIEACEAFCACVHIDAQPLNQCLARTLLKSEAGRLLSLYT